MAADPKKQIKVGLQDIKDIRQAAKALPGAVRVLSGLQDQHCKALGKLKAALDDIKPPPAKTAKLAEIKQLEAAMKNFQAGSKYDQIRRLNNELSDSLSPKGRQRSMLNNLINMADGVTQQHTGDKQGEIFNRASTRQVFMALKGLRDGDKQLDDARKSVDGFGKASSQITGKSTPSELHSAVKAAEADQKAVFGLDRLLDGAGKAIDGAADGLADAFDDALSAKSA